MCASVCIVTIMYNLGPNQFSIPWTTHIPWILCFAPVLKVKPNRTVTHLPVTFSECKHCENRCMSCRRKDEMMEEKLSVEKFLELYRTNFKFNLYPA